MIKEWMGHYAKLGSSFNYYFCAEPVTLRYRHKGLHHCIKSQLHRDLTNKVDLL